MVPWLVLTSIMGYQVTFLIRNVIAIVPWLILTSIMGYQVTILIRNVFAIIPRNLVTFLICLFYNTIILNIIAFSLYKDRTICWIFNPNFVVTIRKRLIRISTLPMFGAAPLTLVN